MKNLILNFILLFISASAIALPTQTWIYCYNQIDPTTCWYVNSAIDPCIKYADKLPEGVSCISWVGDLSSPPASGYESIYSDANITINIADEFFSKFMVTNNSTGNSYELYDFSTSLPMGTDLTFNKINDNGTSLDLIVYLPDESTGLPDYSTELLQTISLSYCYSLAGITLPLSLESNIEAKSIEIAIREHFLEIVTEQNEPLIVKLYDLSGKVLFEGVLRGSLIIELNTIIPSNRIYLLRVNSEITSFRYSAKISLFK